MTTKMLHDTVTSPLLQRFVMKAIVVCSCRRCLPVLSQRLWKSSALVASIEARIKRNMVNGRYSSVIEFNSVIIWLLTSYKISQDHINSYLVHTLSTMLTLILPRFMELFHGTLLCSCTKIENGPTAVKRLTVFANFLTEIFWIITLFYSV